MSDRPDESSALLRAIGLGKTYPDAGREQAQQEFIPVGEQAFGRRETKRYEFLFRASELKSAAALIKAADGIHDSVAAFFGAPPPPSRVVVDLASPVMPHALGQTNWTKIRMPLTALHDLDEQRRVLRHETAHVFIEQLGAGSLSSRFRYLRFFHEGLSVRPLHRRAPIGR